MTEPTAQRPADWTPGGLNREGLLADLTVLCTTDLHMQLLSYDYLADRATDLPSLARLSPLIRRLRNAAANCLLLDCGDFLQGGPMGELFAAAADARPGAGLHPMIGAMNAIGYDAVTLGNHEFNFGLSVLQRMLRDAAFPVVCCNLVRQRGSDPTRDRTVVQPFALIERHLTARDGSRHDVRIGILGLAPPETVAWDGARLDGRIEARPMVEAARAWVPALRARGAEVVIALAHVGPGTVADEETVRALAAIDGIDALCLGHVHGMFPGPHFAALPGADIGRGTLGGKPAVMAGHGGSHIGAIALTLRREPGGWTVAGGNGQLVAPGPADAEDDRAGPGCRIVHSAAAAAHAHTLDHIRTPVGVVHAPVDSLFAALGDSPAQRLVGAALRHWLHSAALDPLPADVPVLAAVPAFRAGGFAGPDSYTDIPAGPLSMRHLHDLYPFPNLLTALRLTGAEVIDWLDRVAAHYGTTRIGVARPLIPVAVPPWCLDAMIGLDYAFDLSRPPRYRLDGTPAGAGRSRVIAARFGGRPLEPESVVIVVTSTHRAAGGGVFRHWPAQRQLRCRSTSGREALVDYLGRNGGVAVRNGHVRRLFARPGSVAVFDTAPAAAERLEQIMAYRPAVETVTPEGFLRLRLHL